MRFQLPRFLSLSSLAVCAMIALPGAARAEDGVTADTIVFGQVAPLEGPASALGLGMRPARSISRLSS